jgi:aquaporin Z
VNPARSLAVAVFQGDWALEQLWVFIVFPVIGGVVGAVLFRVLAGREAEIPLAETTAQ